VIAVNVDARRKAETGIQLPHQPLFNLQLGGICAGYGPRTSRSSEEAVLPPFLSHGFHGLLA
jgi:hypothetical protein